MMKRIYLFLLLFCLVKAPIYSENKTINQEYSPAITWPFNLHIENNVSHITNTIKKHALTIQKEATKILQQTTNFLWNHKTEIIGSILLGASLYTLYNIWEGNNYFSCKNNWSTWKKELTNQDIALIPQADFALELMAEIQHRHLTIDRPTDFLSPVAQFIKTIDKEINQLKRYEQTYRWTSHIYLAPILPFDRKKFARAQEKIERLLYLKHCAVTWLAQYKMIVNMPEYH